MVFLSLRVRRLNSIDRGRQLWQAIYADRSRMISNIGMALEERHWATSVVSASLFDFRLRHRLASRSPWGIDDSLGSRSRSARFHFRARLSQRRDAAVGAPPGSRSPLCSASLLRFVPAFVFSIMQRRASARCTCFIVDDRGDWSVDFCCSRDELSAAPLCPSR